MRVCASHGCDLEIPPQQGRSRPRKYCEKCRPPKGVPNPRVIQLPDVSPTGSDVAVTGDLGLVGAYRRQLEAVGRLDTPEGVHVLTLAALFAAGGHTSSGAASLSRELRAAMEMALKGAPAVPDEMDELAERRRVKASSA